MASNDEVAQPLFVQYTAFKADPAWRRLPYAAREDGREAFAHVIEDADLGIKTYPYSTVGMKTSCDLLLWRKGRSPIGMQELTSRLLQTGIGQYGRIHQHDIGHGQEGGDAGKNLRAPVGVEAGKFEIGFEAFEHRCS